MLLQTLLTGILFVSGLDLGPHQRLYIHKADLHWLRQLYMSYPDKSAFFKPYFENLAGTVTLRNSIVGEIVILKSGQLAVEGLIDLKKTKIFALH